MRITLEIEGDELSTDKLACWELSCVMTQLEHEGELLARDSDPDEMEESSETMIASSSASGVRGEEWVSGSDPTEY